LDRIRELPREGGVLYVAEILAHAVAEASAALIP
jgi:hypothetical protein